MNPSKVMLVTGASRGIGLAIARHHAARGYRVFGTSRRIAARPDDGITMLPLEVTNAESVQDCVGRVLDTTGRLDVLVNNAGFDLYGALEETSIAEFIEQVEVNFLGAVRITRCVLPVMRAQRAGRIVNISSLGGRIGLPMNSAYAASKFALEGFSESLRLEVLPHGLFVSLIAPAAVATDSLDQSIREVRHRESAYHPRRAAMVEQMREDGRTSRVSPAHVAQAVQRACEDPRPLLRYPVGPQATWVPRMKALLPQRRFEAMMRRLFP